MEHVVGMWNGDGGTVWYNSGTVLVVKWNSDGGTVEQWNSGGGRMEQK